MNFGTALVENKSDLKSPLKIETNISMSINKVPLNPRMKIVVKPDQMDIALTENGTKISMDSSLGIIVTGEKFQPSRTFLGTKDFNVVNATNKKKVPLLNSYFISTSKDPSFIEVNLKKAFKESYNKKVKKFPSESISMVYEQPKLGLYNTKREFSSQAMVTNKNSKSLDMIKNKAIKVVDLKTSEFIVKSDMDNAVFIKDTENMLVMGRSLLESVTQYKGDSMFVDGFKEVNTSGTTGEGGLQNLDFVLQPQSFISINMDFGEGKKIKEVVGLPNAMNYFKEENKIKGTPLFSGKYTFIIRFESGDEMIGKIEVPPLQRNL